MRGQRTKRLFDLAISVPLLVLLLPLMAVLGLVIKLETPGPILYRCRRVGLGGREFEMLKFRKMHEDAKGLALTSARDDRLTRVGALLACTKLDELPQLWNVIRGQMSLVGPRPEDPSFVGVHPAGYAEILRIRPGIAGLAQLVYARESRLLDGPELLQHYIQSLLPHKVAIDCLYVARRSIGLDVRILLWTLLVLFGIPAAVDPITARPYRPSQQEREPLPAAIQETSI
jgi:lipopolysaccharide/colanic/teichoic acid biosynthesis glycosyltransferase